MPPKVPKEDLIQDYKRLADELGKAPTKMEYNRHGEYSEAVIYNYFDSMSDLTDAIGANSTRGRIPNEELISDLQRVASEIGRSPPVMVYDEHGEHNSKTLKSRFGNWSSVLKAAGLEPTAHSQNWKNNTPTQVGKEYQSKIEIECTQCGNTAEVPEKRLEYKDNLFCSRECHNEYMRGRTGEEAYKWQGGNVEKECQTCGETFEIVPARADESHYCSYECLGERHKEEQSGEDSPRWKGGYHEHYGQNWLGQREKARQRDEYECQICGLSQAEQIGQIDQALNVHHIKRFNAFDDPQVANQLPNLITLCKWCHTDVEVGEKEIPDEHKERFDEWYSGIEMQSKSGEVNNAD